MVILVTLCLKLWCWAKANWIFPSYHVVYIPTYLPTYTYLYTQHNCVSIEKHSFTNNYYVRAVARWSSKFQRMRTCHLDPDLL